ncbi:MAG: hypothetical protein JJU45_11205 [Acidimicrobiia bacterium]|nr:hypothetical protein [Acidimicrobiia bacterium]
MTASKHPTHRVAALTVPAVVMALLVACSQPPGSPVEHRVYETGVGMSTPPPPVPTPGPPPVDSARFTLDWYTGSVRSLTSDADLQLLLEAWNVPWDAGGDGPPAVRAGESAVVIRAPNDALHLVDVHDVRVIDDDVVVTLDIEERASGDRPQGRCAARWAAGDYDDVFVIVVAVADLPLERVRVEGNIVECEPPDDDEEDEIF